MSTVQVKPSCVNCGSNNVIKHGVTIKGSPRFRCRDCEKTWVENNIRIFKPELNLLTEEFLKGQTFRELVNIYKTAPIRINQKVRSYLSECPNWEDFIDGVAENKQLSVVYLAGKSFACSAGNSSTNSMYLAVAVDLMSSLVIGFEVGTKDADEVWENLISRLFKRGYDVTSFMSNGSKSIELSIKKNYPTSSLKINFFRAYREKEIECCLNNLPFKNKLVNDSLNLYNQLKNKTLNLILNSQFNSSLKNFMLDHQSEYIRFLDRKSTMTHERGDCLLDDFKSRFEKFHRIKDDPYPIINGWMSLYMLKELDCGFNRLSFFLQKPVKINFIDFSKNNKEVNDLFSFKLEELKPFIFEIASRALNLPLNLQKCDLNLSKCEYLNN